MRDYSPNALSVAQKAHEHHKPRGSRLRKREEGESPIVKSGTVNQSEYLHRGFDSLHPHKF